MDADRLVQLTTGPAFTWWVRHVASRLDPPLFEAANGRLTSMGPPAMPMLTITTIGRRSGIPHAVHLACVEHDGGWLVVASAMGQRRHPAWPKMERAAPQLRAYANRTDRNIRVFHLTRTEAR